MSGGFHNPLVGGGGDLVYPEMQSPNFVTGVSGWKIGKDGSAEFQDIIIPAGSGGAVVTFASTAPASPHVGDLWYDTANGLELHQWDGSAWVARQISGPAIAPGGVTTTQINFTARDIGGITTSIASTAPAGAKNGDLWYDSSNGYKLNQYESGAWTAYQYGTSSIAARSITAALIAANTITAAQIASGTITATQIAAATITATQIAAGTITAAKLVSGIVVAGIVDATTITGAQIIADGSSGNFLVYSGTPAAGNLTASVSPVSGNDGLAGGGNAYLAGQVTYTSSGGTFYALQVNAGAVNFLTATSASGPWTGVQQISVNGFGDLILTPGFSSTHGVVFSLGTTGLLQAQQPGIPSNIESWHALGAPSAGWTVSGHAQYKIDPTGELWLSFKDIVPGTTVADGTVVFSAANGLPSGYRPANNRRILCYSTGQTGNVGGTAFELETDGSIQCYGFTRTSTGRADLYGLFPITE